MKLNKFKAKQAFIMEYCGLSEKHVTEKDVIYFSHGSTKSLINALDKALKAYVEKE